MVSCVALIDSSYTIFGKLPLCVSMNTQCSFNECSTCISTMQRRPGVITELVLAFSAEVLVITHILVQKMENNNVLQCKKE